MLNSHSQTSSDSTSRVLALLESIQQNNLNLDSQAKKLLRDVKYYPDEKYLSQLQILIQQNNFSKNAERPIAYVGGLKFEDFEKTGCLHRINNSAGNNTLYFYYDKNFITDFNKSNENDQLKFDRITNDENLKLAASVNEQGIKYLKNSKALPQCHLNIKHQDYLAKFTHELKINGSKNRLAIVTLKPETEGPQILIATHMIKGGFHNKKHNGKTLTANEFKLKPINKTENYSVVSKLGLFAKNKPSCKPEMVQNELHLTQPILTK